MASIITCQGTTELVKMVSSLNRPKSYRGRDGAVQWRAKCIQDTNHIHMNEQSTKLVSRKASFKAGNNVERSRTYRECPGFLQQWVAGLLLETSWQ